MSSTVLNLTTPLLKFQSEFTNLIVDQIADLGPPSKLRDACQYALMNGGKRFRPFLLQLIGDALGYQGPLIKAKLAIEYLHTASLIADDLPCMDNDNMRRGRPSVHKVYGETTALLASYALIAAGYGFLAQCSNDLAAANLPFSTKADSIGMLALQNVTYNTGLLGATGGQYIDIFPEALTLELLIEVIQKKTVSLFEISFVLGWLFGGGEISQLPVVKEAAGHFGRAFQFADDIGDRQQDEINGRKINVAALFGVDRAREMLEQERRGYEAKLKELNIASPPLMELSFWLQREGLA